MEILVVVGAVLMMLAVEFSTAKPTAKRWSRPSMTDAAKLMGINTGLVITFPTRCRRSQLVLPAVH
jgi:branched-chain amino acid transport system permease protein